MRKKTHNSNLQGGPLNGNVNQTLDPVSADGTIRSITVTLKPEKDPLFLKCNIHNWMSAYIRAFDHPYAATTSVGAEPAKKLWENADSPQFGQFKIEGVPVGAKVRLFAWHENLKYLTDAKGMDLTLKEEQDIPLEAEVK